MIKSNYPIITVTGTKGKTSVARMLDFALGKNFEQVLRVDTDGAYINGSLIFSDDESRDRWGYTPTNCPGRFLALISDKSNISILESTVFSSKTGLGYKAHDIGIFTNVFEDHLGGTKMLKTVEDIAKHKSFVLKSIKKGGTAIYNGDDDLVVSQLSVIKPGVNRIAVTKKRTQNSDGAVCYISEKNLEIIVSGKTVLKLVLNDFHWLQINHGPSLYNFAFVVSALFSLLSKEKFNSSINLLSDYTYDPAGGRMVQLKIADGPRVILDFAHEKQSLIEIAKYARSLVGNDNSVVGVVRLAPSRTAELIDDTAKSIVPSFDKFIVYDMVDGFLRKAGVVKGFANKKEEVGYISKLFYGFLHKYGAKSVKRIIREDEAIAAAISDAKQNDVVIYIVSGDSRRSFEFLKAAADGKKVIIL
ncbi:MAG: Mur ligase family protein [Candidatus Saccharibacteria bacterium]|nr:Mur ligase family protein [Candidatus Saccharibacteria bacterium]